MYNSDLLTHMWVQAVATVTITAVAVAGVVRCLPCKLTLSLGKGRVGALCRAVD